MALPVICGARCWHELGCGWQKTSRKRLFMDVRGYFEGALRDLMMGTVATFPLACLLFRFCIFSPKKRLFTVCSQAGGLWYVVSLGEANYHRIQTIIIAIAQVGLVQLGQDLGLEWLGFVKADYVLLDWVR